MTYVICIETIKSIQAKALGLDPADPDFTDYWSDVAAEIARAASVKPPVALPPPVSLFGRAIVLLKTAVDEPMASLPGGVEPGWKGPSSLWLHQFRPDLSEKIALLLEELGQ